RSVVEARPNGHPSPAASLHLVAVSLLTGRFPASRAEATTEPEAPDARPSAVAPGPAGAEAPAASAIYSASGRRFAKEVARLGFQVARALDYAHGQGVLHRDVKPSNLLLDVQGTVWVADFGLAKAVADGDDLTGEGDVLGTL